MVIYEFLASISAALFWSDPFLDQKWRIPLEHVADAFPLPLWHQNNRFNIIMLCDTVCLGCVFSLAADGSPPVETAASMLGAYIACLGVSIMLFTVSLWASVIVVRRLYDNTAARLERKLFLMSDDLQRAWRDQLALDQPTGPQEMYLVHQVCV